jgi:hypothetical protein
MTRPVLLAALSLLSEVESVAAAEQGDGDQARYLARLSDEALDMVGGEREQDEAVMVAGEWLASRHVPSAEEGWADVGT